MWNLSLWSLHKRITLHILQAGSAVDCAADFSVHALEAVFSKRLIVCELCLRYKSISLLVVGTLHVNNTHSLQEVKGGLQRIICKSFVTGAVGVV